MPGRSKGIDSSKVPEDRWKDVTYRRIVLNVCPWEAETNITRLTVGGNNTVTVIDYRTLTGNLLTITLLLSSIISTSGVKFLGLDLNEFYLITPMDRS